MKSKEEKDNDYHGGFELTHATLKKLCKDLNLYSSCPELNEVLHLHQKGIVKLKNLEEYTGLRTIYLENNAISKIEGLDKLVNIRCLYLNENLVEDISGLDNLIELETLDLSNNQIKTIQGLAKCTKLRQLNLSGNKIKTMEDTFHLKDCSGIQSLDMSNNRIDNELTLELLRSLQLRLLRLVGNPIVSQTRHYRKKTITSIKELQYMDDSPVFEKDRRLAEAWSEGGIPAEQEMREIIRKEEASLREKHLKAFDDLVQNAKERLQQEDMQRRQASELEDNEMPNLIKSEFTQSLSTDIEARPPILADLMDEDEREGLQSQVVDPRKRDADTFDSHIVTSPRKLRKCSLTNEDQQSKDRGLIGDCTTMEVDTSFSSTNLQVSCVVDDLHSTSSCGSDKLVNQTHNQIRINQIDETTLIVEKDETGIMMESTLETYDVECQNKGTYELFPIFYKEVIEDCKNNAEISNYDVLHDDHQSDQEHRLIEDIVG